MEKTRKNVVVVFGDPTKRDYVKPGFKFDKDDFDTTERLKAALRELNNYTFIYLDNHNTLLKDLMELKKVCKIDFVFNLCDEGYENNPQKEFVIPALLDSLEIRYTGAGPECMIYCYNKLLVKNLAKELKIPVPKHVLFIQGDFLQEGSFPFGFPVMVKPNFGDGGVGITQKSLVHNFPQLERVIETLVMEIKGDKQILIEEFLPGKDLSLGIIGNPPNLGYMLLPITEEDYSALPEDLPRICGYEAKWYPDSPYWKINSAKAVLQGNIEKIIVDSSVQLFKILKCRDYARFDWRLDKQDEPRLLEVNPNPGWCWDGHLAKMAKFNGMSYPGMLESILKSAERRFELEDIPK